MALINESQHAEDVAATTGIPVVHCNPDSGCTASCTPDCTRLINQRECSEIFGQANGHITRAVSIGDMPVLGRAVSPEGKDTLVRFTFTNVRCVPLTTFAPGVLPWARA